MSDVALQEVVLAPEGIELRFGTATASERLIALTLDIVLLLLIALVAGFLLAIFFGVGAVMLVFFLVRQGYFVWFETRWNGSTPGKRPYHLRVIRADGGPLRTEIVLARNLTREVELWLPVSLMLNPDTLFVGHTGVVRVVAGIWVLLLLFFPLCNAHRLRLGDLLAGTRVVVSPPVALLRDLADLSSSKTRYADLQLTEQQLSIYGEYELQVLADVLRKARMPAGDKAIAAVAEKIADRIGWLAPMTRYHDQFVFLRQFYRAQRQHLEHRLLLGQRRDRKHAGETPSGVKPPTR